MSQPWMEHAWAHIGVRETKGKAATAEIVAMYAAAGRPDITSDDVPWCSAFVGKCTADAGLPRLIDIGVPKDDALMARSWLKYGTKLDEPKVGCIVVLKRGAPPAGHVGFLTGWGDGYVRVLGGNQSDAVNEARFKEADVLGYRWPPEKPPVAVVNATKPLRKSGTMFGLTGASFGAVGMWFHDAVSWTMNLGLEAIKAITDLAPLRDALISSGANVKGTFFSLTTFGIVYAASRRVKAKQEAQDNA